MRAKFPYIVFLFLLISCNSGKTGFKNYEVSVWRASYNPTELPTNDYTVKLESDTLIEGSPIHLDSTHVRSLLYRNFETVDQSKWDRQIFKIRNDTLVRYSNMLESVWYDPQNGILRVTFPHSRGPERIRSYELVKKIQITNGTKRERNYDSTISVIKKIRDKEREKFIEGLKQQN